ncbi:MBL fold metallo-hydrolase [Algoriphagus sp. CAU 1675]|uniref:MBL fold metallo-hydrolase n=1 Tax=Algoriphagus sp. CAU 1675 TaxID=3032597 RepID=UPI0023DA906D|nr:MBL fold metallo-hydrolase [Algoriphagus sp. CAU 1675]MDF2159377.1 MBL fold metallo-hydrolase [Algoriphagus sp. CAU 1675]
MEVQLIRNATLKLKYAGKTFLIDPFLAPKFSIPSFAGKSKNPTSELPLSIEDILKDVDFVLVSHLHPDHFDEVAQQVIPKEIPLYCQKADASKLVEMGFETVHPLNDSQWIEGIQLQATEGMHGRGEILNFMGNVSGFVFSHFSEKTIYWCGDTVWYEGVMETIDRVKPEIIVCHAGGNRFFKKYNALGVELSEDTLSVVMDERQVVELSQYASNCIVIATHIGALDHETLTREMLREFANSKGISSSRLMIPQNGEILFFTH